MSRNLSEDHPDKRAAANEFGTRQLFRRPATRQRTAVLFIKVFGDRQVLTTGDGKFIFAVSRDMDEMELIDAEAYVSGASTSGTISVSILNITQAQDMLSTPLTIDANEKTTCTAASTMVINEATAAVAHCDLIEINVDGAGANALGLGVMLTFGPGTLAA